MKTTIYYFSATGNSLQLARGIASGLDNCELVSITKVINNEAIHSSSDRIGIIFPVFAWGMPRIVTDFVNKLSFDKKPYTFAAATCVAIQGNTLKDLKQLLKQKGSDLNAGFAVKSGRSSLMQLNLLDKIIIVLDRQRKKNKTTEERLEEMVNTIKNCSKHKPETSTWTANIFGSMLHNIGLKTFRTIDSQFVVSDSCKGCGNCAKICPRLNIVIENGRPVFNHNCELCHACIQWCPNFAIKHPNFDNTLRQYRNPAVSFKDILAC